MKQFSFFSLILILLTFPNSNFSQIKLTADGEGNTYELINSVLVHDHKKAVETPDCSHTDFGKHISEVFDKDLNKFVFKFDIHINEDFDRCKRFDRQRNEIKANKRSSDTILATEGETLQYSWKFKLPKNFKVCSKYTDVHQITYRKIKGNEPLFAFMARKKDGKDSFQIVYINNDKKEVLKSIRLSKITDQWIVASETITYGKKGSYNVVLSTLDGQTILTTKRKNIQTWYENMVYARPKWGIYRSLKKKEELRDEQLFFADFEINDLTHKK